MEPTEIKEFRNRIGKAIRKLREEEGVSANYLAKVLGVTQPTVSRIENGTTSIAAEKLCFLAKAYNRPLSYFVGEQSPLLYNRDDIIRAGLVYYGASHLKCKRTINIQDYYKSYADFLNDALNEADDDRTAAAIATTLYVQAKKNSINNTQIITTLGHKRLVANLWGLIHRVVDGKFYIKRPSKEKELVFKTLLKLSNELEKEYPNDHRSFFLTEFSPLYVAQFINASFGHE